MYGMIHGITNIELSPRQFQTVSTICCLLRAQNGAFLYKKDFSMEENKFLIQ